jgi:hypothetical protein
MRASAVGCILDDAEFPLQPVQAPQGGDRPSGKPGSVAPCCSPLTLALG